MDNNEEINDLSLDNVGEYKLPQAEDIVLDLSQNKVLDSKELSPIQMIYLTAKQKGITIKEFPINEKGYIDSGCRKKGCFGRGYKGWAGNIPIPCECLFEDKNVQSDGVTINRKIIRNYHKVIQKEQKAIIQKKMVEHGLKPLGKTHFELNEDSGVTSEYKIYGKIKKGTKELIQYIWKDYEHEGKKNWDFRRLDTLKQEIKEDV